MLPYTFGSGRCGGGADIVQALAGADLRSDREEAPASITLLAGYVRAHRSELLGAPLLPLASPPLPNAAVRPQGFRFLGRPSPGRGSGPKPPTPDLDFQLSKVAKTSCTTAIGSHCAHFQRLARPR